MGDATSGPVRLSFNPQLRVEFRGATVTSDAGVLLPRELDERLRLCTLIDRHRTDPRTGGTTGCGVCHPPPGQRCLGAGHRGPAHPAPRPTEPRPAGALPELSVSGRVLRPAAAGDRQGRASPGRTLSSGGL